MNLNLSTATRIGLNLLALLGVVVALWLGRTIFIPATIAVFLAALLWPVARGIHQSLGVPWGIACFLVIALVLVINFGVFFSFTLAVPKVLQDLPAPGDTYGQEQLY